MAFFKFVGPLLNLKVTGSWSFDKLRMTEFLIGMESWILG